MEGATAKLRCELSKAAPVEWRKGPETLRAGHRVSLRQDGAVCELEIRELTVEDAGEYSCVCGQERTSATLAVRGKDRVWPCGRCLVAAVASALSSLSCPVHSLPGSFSFPNYSVLLVTFSVCSSAHVQVGPFKVTVTVCTGTPRIPVSSWVLCLLCTLHFLLHLCVQRT